ncbi:MAG: RNA methyltransferase [Hyphomicrobiaceae bacterium]|nr:MAG: RNA methyltransferase [Hyphomicrobiaceae bacterium]
MRRGGRAGNDRPRKKVRDRSGARPAAVEPAKGLHKIAGLPAVLGVFERDPGRIERLYFVDALKLQLGSVCLSLAKSHKPYRIVRPDELTRIAETAMHGGVVAVVEPRPVRELDLKEAAGWGRTGEPLLVLDGVGNPHNLGAIARTAAFFGVKRLLLADRPEQALPSDAAYRVARGGLEHIEVYRARRLAEALRRLAKDYHVVAAAAVGGAPLSGLRSDGRPIALVLGNEEEGAPQATLEAVETIVTIGGSKAVQSLNVAASAAILIAALMAPLPNRPAC